MITQSFMDVFNKTTFNTRFVSEIIWLTEPFDFSFAAYTAVSAYQGNSLSVDYAIDHPDFMA